MVSLKALIKIGVALGLSQRSFPDTKPVATLFIILYIHHVFGLALSEGNAGVNPMCMMVNLTGAIIPAKYSFLFGMVKPFIPFLPLLISYCSLYAPHYPFSLAI